MVSNTVPTQENTRQPIDKAGHSIPVLRLGETEKVSTGNQSTAATEDKIVRVVCDDDSHILIGADPTATTSSVYFPANHVEYISLNKADKISVLGGNMYVTDCE